MTNINLYKNNIIVDNLNQWGIDTCSTNPTVIQIPDYNYFPPSNKDKEEPKRRRNTIGSPFNIEKNYFKDIQISNKQDIPMNELNIDHKLVHLIKLVKKIQENTNNKKLKLYEGICPICFIQNVDIKIIPCGHVIHGKCFIRWIHNNKSCPMCRNLVESVNGISKKEDENNILTINNDTNNNIKIIDSYYQLKSLDSTIEETPETIESEKIVKNNNNKVEETWGWFADTDNFYTMDEFVHSLSESGKHNIIENKIKNQNIKNSYIHFNSKSLFMNKSNNQEEISTISIVHSFEKKKKSSIIKRSFAPVLTDSNDKLNHKWMELNRHSHISVSIRILGFRVTSGRTGKYAEYLIETIIENEIYKSWKRHSEFSYFVSFLKMNNQSKYIGIHSFRNARNAWKKIVKFSRWFDRLDIKYLHQKSLLLEYFLQQFLYEAPSVEILLNFIEKIN